MFVHLFVLILTITHLLPERLLAVDIGEAEKGFAAQPSLDLEEVSRIYREYLSDRFSAQDFREKIAHLQRERIWDFNAVSFPKDLYKKERLGSPEFTLPYCQILLLFKEEFADEYSEFMEECPMAKVSPRVGERFSFMKVNGYLFQHETFQRREWLQALYHFQFVATDGKLRTVTGYPRQLEGIPKAPSEAGLASITESDREDDEQFSADEFLSVSEPKYPGTFYERNKMWVWLGRD